MLEVWTWSLPRSPDESHVSKLHFFVAPVLWIFHQDLMTPFQQLRAENRPVFRRSEAPADHYAGVSAGRRRARCAVWQVTGEPRSCFQGQCCNLQVKPRNSIPVRGAVTCLHTSQHPPRCGTLAVVTHIRHLCKQARLCVTLAVCVVLLPEWGGPRACCRAESLRTRPAVLWNQTSRQAQC